MLDVARDIIGTQPILAAFLAIGLGYLVGQISIGGFSLGVGAVLFVGLAIGAFAPKAQIVGPIGLTGLIMFLYGIGILYGRQFFHMAEVSLSEHYAGLALPELMKTLPYDVQVTMVRQGSQNRVPSNDIKLAAGDVLMIVADDQSTIAEATTLLGHASPGDIVK